MFHLVQINANDGEFFRRCADGKEKVLHLVADDTMAEVIQLEENLRRKKLPNEAAAVARLVELHQRFKPARRGGDRRSDDFKSSKRQLVISDTPVGRVSKLLGQSEREVRRKLVIGRKGTPELQAALVDGTINVLQAEKLARLPAEDQRTALHTPDEDAEMKRALSALAFVERTIAKQASANEQLVVEVRTRLARLQDLVAGLKTTKVASPSGDAAAAVDFSPKSANRKLSPIEMLPGRQRPHFTPRPPYVGDTTELLVGEHGAKLYLAVILDLFARFVVGWALSARNDRHLVMKAMEMALRRRRPKPGLIFHSDQGSPYASEDHQTLLAEHGIVSSMSRRGNCYDNAAMESWFSTYKAELGERFTSDAEVKDKTFDYVECFYNTTRRHSALDYMSPARYERAAEEKRAA